jgi:hypothetical protein
MLDQPRKFGYVNYATKSANLFKSCTNDSKIVRYGPSNLL